MKKKVYSEEEIIKILQEHTAGAMPTELCRRYGIASSTFFKWRGKYGGMEVSDARKLKALEEENRRLKRLVADLSLDIAMLKDVNAKKW